MQHETEQRKARPITLRILSQVEHEGEFEGEKEKRTPKRVLQVAVCLLATSPVTALMQQASRLIHQPAEQ